MRWPIELEELRSTLVGNDGFPRVFWYEIHATNHRATAIPTWKKKPTVLSLSWKPFIPWVDHIAQDLDCWTSYIYIIYVYYKVTLYLYIFIWYIYIIYIWFRSFTIFHIIRNSEICWVWRRGGFCTRWCKFLAMAPGPDILMNFRK